MDRETKVVLRGLLGVLAGIWAEQRCGPLRHRSHEYTFVGCDGGTVAQYPVAYAVIGDPFTEALCHPRLPKDLGASTYTGESRFRARLPL